MTASSNGDKEKLLAMVKEWIGYRTEDVAVKNLQVEDVRIIINYLQAAEQMRFNDLLEEKVL